MDTKSSPDNLLQMTVRAINDTADPDELVPTLIVFGGYPRMGYLDRLSSIITQRACGINKVMEDLCKIQSKTLLGKAPGQRNGSTNFTLYYLQHNSQVFLARIEIRPTRKLEGLLKLIAVKNVT